MNIPRSLLILALAPAALLLPAACSKADKDNAHAVVEDIKNAASDTWTSIKDFTYEQRVQFSDSVDRMSAKMDHRVDDIRAKTPTASDSTSATKRAAIKDYDDARVDLKASLAELNAATAEHWADAKAKVEAAWRRMKADYDKATE
jgi:hypothetical protein